MFRKKVFRDHPPIIGARNGNADTNKPTETIGTPTINALEIMRLGPAEYIRQNLNAGIGAKDGVDPNSLVIWSGYLAAIINLIAVMKDTMSMDVSIYTVGGLYNSTSKHADKFDIRAIVRNLQKKADFVVELSNSIGSSHILHFYLYDITPTGQASIRSNRAWLKKCHADEITSIYHPSNFSVKQLPIDAVYTWVNHADPHWQELWMESFPEEAFDPDRYTSNDELKYSLRSLNKYAPWINKIYIVTNCSRPEWLFDHDKIVWVHHEEVFPNSDMLPSFSSHAIEACLHNIQGLSEQFLYLNDDVILNSPCLPSDFFDETGRSLSFFEPYGMVDSSPAEELTPDYLVAAKNSKALLSQQFENYEARSLHRHVAFALRKSVLQELELTFPDAFEATRYAKRRARTDVNVTSFLYHHYGYAKGHSIKGDISGIIVRPGNVGAIATTDSYKYKILCFNDGNGSAENVKYKTVTQSYFDKRMFEKSPWEKKAIHRQANESETLEPIFDTELA